MSGYTICNKLKKDPLLSSIPLVITSSQATAETFEQHSKLKTRADGYLRKPYGTQQLIELVEQLLGVSAQKEPSVAKPPAVEPLPAAEIDVSSLLLDQDSQEESFKQKASMAIAPVDIPIEAKAAPVAQTVPPEPSRVSTAAAIDSMQQQEVRQLRQKVQQLEQAMQDQQITFQDKLLQHSGSLREQSELKNKIVAQDLEINQLKQAAQHATSQAHEAAEKLRQIQALQQTEILEKQELLREVAQSKAQLKESQNTVQRLQQQTVDLQQAVETADKQLQELKQSHLAAKHAIDHALQDLLADEDQAS